MQITKVNLPTNKFSLKCPYPMSPQYITVHNTANNASAMAEISYMQGNDSTTSFHYAVDDYRTVQGLPLDRNGWHAGDGAYGTGNRATIGIEICYSLSGGERFIKAEKNGAELVARLLLAYGWDISRVKKHQDWSGKYCPHRTLDMGWQRFLNMVQANYNQLRGVKPQPKPQPKPTPQPQSQSGQLYKVTVDALNIRKGAGTNYEITGVIRDYGTYTIVEKQGDWGKLKSGAGWIYLGYANYVGQAGSPNPEPTPKPKPTPKKSIAEIVAEVKNGKWGNYPERKTRLEAAGYNYAEVQAQVNASYGQTPKKSNDQIAQEVIDGKWGNNPERKQRLEAAGYNYKAVQTIVNRKLGY